MHIMYQFHSFAWRTCVWKQSVWYHCLLQVYASVLASGSTWIPTLLTAGPTHIFWNSPIKTYIYIETNILRLFVAHYESFVNLVVFHDLDENKRMCGRDHNRYEDILTKSHVENTDPLDKRLYVVSNCTIAIVRYPDSSFGHFQFLSGIFKHDIVSLVRMDSRDLCSKVESHSCIMILHLTKQKSQVNVFGFSANA